MNAEPFICITPQTSNLQNKLFFNRYKGFCNVLTLLRCPNAAKFVLTLNDWQLYKTFFIGMNSTLKL